MRITEDLHHGDYQNVRTAEIAGDYLSFVEFVQSSPYAGGAVKKSNVYLQKAYNELVTTGKGGFGWAWYTTEASKAPQSVAELASMIDPTKAQHAIALAMVALGWKADWDSGTIEDVARALTPAFPKNVPSVFDQDDDVVIYWEGLK